MTTLRLRHIMLLIHGYFCIIGDDGVKSYYSLVLTLIVFISGLTAGCNSNKSTPALDYWYEAKPIVVDHIDKVGRPIANVILEVGPELRAGDKSAARKFITVLKDTLPDRNKTYVQLSKLGAPGGVAGTWHLAQLKAWGMQLQATQMLLSCWNFTEGVATCAEEDANRASKAWDDSLFAGQEADRLQQDLVSSLTK